ncbi:hypothetical protein ACNAN0_10845 [Agrilactobacillus fermenti]|uniref:hypothetical protein n=1 Tax=Agrilactobacillus fermenti TaxID=2586909 RepID=UPI003A5C486C
MANDVDFSAIVQDVVLQKYGDTSVFSTQVLLEAPNFFDQWLAGKVELSKIQGHHLRQLFTDYEWMLCQKAIFQSQSIPELNGRSAYVYANAKKQIAKQWLAAENCESAFTKEQVQGRAVIHLRISLNYDLWGFEDVLDFIVPETVRSEIETKQLDLLTWVNNLKIEA